MLLLSVSTVQGHSKFGSSFVSNCRFATGFDPILGLSLFLGKPDNDPGLKGSKHVDDYQFNVKFKL